METLQNPEKCAQRRRLAARRDEVEAVPIRLLHEAPLPHANLTYSIGELPEDDPQALSKINARQIAEGKRELSEEEVYIRYMEAANSNFVGDRFMFMGESTLRNIASGAERGFAFMNSHRTGGLSAPAELPYGRTFCGRFETWQDAHGEVHHRALVGVYLLRGKYPNGESGPSTDTMVEGIDAGTIFDVSVGLYGGERICDVCGNGLYDTDNQGNHVCPHYPGTAYRMSDAQREAQRARGIPKGYASYTLQDATCGEVSSVFDGAIPGAGFRKGYGAIKAGAFGTEELEAFCQSFSGLLAEGEKESMEKSILQEIREGFANLGADLKSFMGGKKGDAPPAVEEPHTTEELTLLKTELARAQVQLASLETARAEEANTAREERVAELGKRGYIAPGAMENAQKLAALDEDTFRAFVMDQGPMTAFAKTGAKVTRTEAAEVSGDGSAEESLVKLAEEYAKSHGCSYTVAWSAVCSDPNHRDLLAQRSLGKNPNRA